MVNALYRWIFTFIKEIIHSFCVFFVNKLIQKELGSREYLKNKYVERN